MVRMRRRNMLIGFGTVVFGTSGFIASGAYDVGSEGRAGGNWVQVEAAEEIVEDEEGEKAEEPTRSLIQVVADPDNDGNYVNSTSYLQWDGEMDDSTIVRSDDNGLFEGLAVENVNKEAVSRIGFVDTNGYPTDRMAFLIANVGNPDVSGGGLPVLLTAELIDGDSPISSTTEFNLPYRVVNLNGDNPSTRGTDLLEDAIELPVAHIVQVVIEFDSRDGTSDVENVDALQFSPQRI